MSLNNKLQFTFTSLLYMTLYQADLINTEIAEMKIYKLVVCVFTPGTTWKLNGILRQFSFKC